MSILSSLFEALNGAGAGASGASLERPCSNCPSDCAIAGDACAVCEPYKRELLDAVYYADHIEEFRSQYEVSPTADASQKSGTVNCPFCGAPSSDPYVCEYCGSRIADGAPSGKIKVASAADIPNPIMQAQDIIY